MPGFDFDLSDSNLNVGIELEYPAKGSSDKLYVNRGRDTSGLSRSATIPPSYDGAATYDGTVGLEVVSEVLDLEDVANWHRDIVEYVEGEYNAEYQPVGLMQSGSTAGLHIHLSPLSERQARDLYEISQTAWAKVLFCSSIANDNGEAAWPVFRGGGHCRMEYNGSRYSCVNARGNRHYEWRMPEPMDSDHLEIVARFLRLFEQDTDLAIQYAQEVLDDGDDRITSIKRAEATGMHIEDIPDVRREPAPEDPENFYSEVESEWAAPQIYLVEIGGERYYAFDSNIDGEFEVNGITVQPNTALYVDSLNRVQDQDVEEDVVLALQRRDAESLRETEATDELKEIVKKKKGK